MAVGRSGSTVGAGSCCPTDPHENFPFESTDADSTWNSGSRTREVCGGVAAESDRRGQVPAIRFRRAGGSVDHQDVSIAGTPYRFFQRGGEGHGERTTAG